MESAAERCSDLFTHLLRREVEWKATFALVFVLIVIPLVSYAIVADVMGFAGQRLNFDLFGLHIATVWFARSSYPRATIPFAVAGTAVILAVQILLGVGVIYLDNPALISEYLSFVAFWPWRIIGLWLMIVAAVFVGFAMVLRRIRIERAAVTPVLVALLALFVADRVGQSTYGQKIVGGNWVTSSALKSYQFAIKVATAPSWTVRPYVEPMMAREMIRAPSQRHMLSIAVEAYGSAAHNPAFNEAILAPMRRELAGVYDIRVTSHQFHGPTLSGEFRELCNVETMGKPTREQAQRLSRSCLPHLLGVRGYATMGIHGNSQNFYNRSVVYPAIGFQHTRFFEDYSRSGKAFTICHYNAFQGVCDREIMNDVLAFFAANARSYVHVMSLDTHFPLAENEAGDDTCGRNLQIADPSLCLYANQFASFFAQIARKLHDAKVKPEIVYMFGDHAPPFATVKERNFFDRLKVPVLVLTLKQN